MQRPRMYCLNCISLFILILIIHSCTPFKGAIWSINNGKLVPKINPLDTKAHAYWAHIQDILPNSLLDKYIVSFKLFSDGADEDLGGLAPLDRFNQTWEMDIDTTDFNLKNLDSLHILQYTHTIIHEFGHLLTLNPTQVTITNDKWQDDSLGYLTQEGYANKDGYLGLFVKTFWKEQLLDEWDNIQRTKIESIKVNRLYDFYLNHQSEFVSDYAAESPEEDIAESWTYFILAEKPKGTEIRHQKVLFFYDFVELTDYRKEIREKLFFVPENYINSAT